MKFLSMRYLGWAAATAAATVFPSLEAQIPIFRKTIPLREAGTASVIERQEDLRMSPEEATFGEVCEHRVPPHLTRSVALAELHDATVMGNTGSVVDETRQAVLLPKGQHPSVTYLHMRGLMRRKIVRAKGSYFNMVGPDRGHRHFYHFLIEYLPRLYYLLHEFPLGKEDLSILVNADLSQFQKEIFALVSQKHPNIRFEPVPFAERWQLPRLYVLDNHSRAENNGKRILRVIPSAQEAAFVRQLIFDLYKIKPPVAGSRRLYISRSDAANRRLLNEGAIHGLLERHGFEMVVPGKLSVSAQAELFSQASAICAPHGAGLANILFAAPGAQIIELFPADNIPGHYLALAKVLGHSHHALIGTPRNRNGDFSVDAAALDAIMAGLPQPS